jgi:Restriction endonuclease
VIKRDWPKVRAGLPASLYMENEALPVSVADLGEIVATRPRGPVVTQLQWDRLTPEDFERLIFSLITGETGYENPEWLMKTNAPDRGRDLSVYRVAVDALSGSLRSRVIIQCKHWLTKSVSVSDFGAVKEQVVLWEPPRVNVLVIATSGRFTSDAVQAIEKHNEAGNPLRIEIWPESHLERLLAARPGLIAEFSLRKP